MASQEQGLSADLLYLLHRNSYRREIREELYRAVGEVSGGARVERLSDAINAVGDICIDPSKCQELWIRVVRVLKNQGADAIKQLEEIDKFSRGNAEEGDVLAMVHMLEPGYRFSADGGEPPSASQRSPRAPSPQRLTTSRLMTHHPTGLGNPGSPIKYISGVYKHQHIS
ncbi:MAG: hypothetical protein RQ885_06380 [Desulfurococcales archaeon]|nr:hypothetical protein [Desulfurococcales archaeon]